MALAVNPPTLETSAAPAVIGCDLYEEDASTTLAGAAIQALGHVDILVNNAGGSRRFTLESTDEQWEEALTLNFRRHRQLTHLLHPRDHVVSDVGREARIARRCLVVPDHLLAA